ncbi:TPA: AAA family ATPase [Vibrio parahaemolyticus]|uniref:AAA family ATPase n=1 Tax=Vibrio parahaemolyticus TaxID=670 RepID=UPI000425E971|nr:AAA family ATPase [Vibrio parahaemolyticus]EJE1249929.1 AAA family ATPase [Vibrio parahaemolyticus]EJG1862850.1 AAA family ATPase [Vibrio parahaemolyticus]EKA4543633.1 AAA family ATPase [Vibrio parahaemolyticus]ELB2250801.1 AAA family ATPase [Vibrio parahaemolyticus]HCE4752425.1 AAA family ATPase [Vibrio parahaemolyticus]
MAKKRSTRTSSPKPMDKPQASISNGVLGGLLKKVGVSSDETLLSKLNEEEKQALADLTAQLEELIETNQRTKKEQDDTLAEINSNVAQAVKDSEEAKSKLQSIGEKEESLAAKEKELLSQLNELSKKEQLLLEQEANAKAGFALERQKSLESLKSEYQQVEQKIAQLEEKRRKNELEMIEQQAKSNELAKEQQNSRFEELKRELQAEKDAIESRQLVLDKQINENNLLNSQLKKQLGAQAVIKKQALEDSRREFQTEKVTLENQLKLLEDYRNRDQNEIKLLTERLLGYKELEREAQIKELGSPGAVLKRIDELEKELRDARNKLKGRSEDSLEEELDYYKDRVDDLEEELRDLKQEHDEVKQREGKYKLSVREKLELQKQKDLLEASNAALTHSIEAVKSQLDDLIEKQQSQEVFKELTLMDRKYREPVPAQPVNSLKEFTEELQHRIARATDVDLYYDLDVLRKFMAGLALSPLHVFQGISGTGKTSLVNAFAAAVGGEVTTVPVQAGWRDRDDLIGHYNAFEKRYYEKECLQGLYKAHTPSFEKRFNIILLDEMNLSRPEQYFAEFLSAMEQNKKKRKVVLMDSSVANPPKYFVEDRKLLLKSNTWFMGTANHDETTFEFADKTHDRAFTLDLEKQIKPKGWCANSIKNTVIDFDSVDVLFTNAQKTHKNLVLDMLNKLTTSEFTKILERQFDIGWGNRLEAQALRFISVYKECGGHEADALEHLLITRVLRKGKVLGRYDISIDKLKDLKNALINLFKSLKGGGSKAIEIIESEITRKEQGVY